MFYLQSGSLIEIHTPAKINLFLEILARREDGFHEIETLMTAITIFDTLYFSANEEGHLRLTCQWAGGMRARIGADRRFSSTAVLGDLPNEKDNIVYRAIQRLRQQAGATQGASIRLVKRIPSAAGLGGASSDAAAALVAANAAWKLGYTRAQLARLAAELGSDIPFFLYGGAAVCRGRGERIEPVANMPKLHFVVVRPPAGLSTAKVYANCQPAGQPRQVETLLDENNDGKALARGVFNRLQQPAAKLSPWIGKLQQEFDRLDLLGHQMSGSGTSYFGVCRHAKHARRVAARIRARNMGAVYYASSVPA